MNEVNSAQGFTTTQEDQVRIDYRHLAEGGLNAVRDSATVEARQAEQAFQVALKEGFFSDHYLEGILPLIDTPARAQQAIETFFSRYTINLSANPKIWEDNVRKINQVFTEQQEQGKLKVDKNQVDAFIKEEAQKRLDIIKDQMFKENPMEYAFYFIGDRNQAIDFLVENRRRLLKKNEDSAYNFKDEAQLFLNMQQIADFQGNLENGGGLFRQNQKMWSELMNELAHPLDTLKRKKDGQPLDDLKRESDAQAAA
jgi:hypothetical protein